jgi:hypothetical protein
VYKRLSTILLIILSASLIAVPVAASGPAADGGPPPLFSPAPAPASPQMVDAGTAILASAYVTLNQADFSGQEQIRLNLLPDVDLVATRRRAEYPFPGAWNWAGQVDGDPWSEVTFASVDGVLTGNIRTGGAFYQVNAAGDGLYRINQLDPLGFPDEQAVPAPRPPAPAQALAPAQAQDDGSTFDVLIVYTANAASAAAASGGILNKINLAVSESNTGYANSQIIPRMRLVHSAQVGYSENNFNWYTTLDLLWKKGDGYMDEVHTLRDAYGADLVSLVVGDSYNNTCGMGWLIGGQPVATTDEAYAFSVVALPCFTGNYSLAHETGHNLGSAHDRSNAVDPGSYPYSYGYQAPDRAFRTIMAYECTGGHCPRINHWSNPGISYNGQPTGISSGTATAADNHLSVNNNRLAVSNFRQAKTDVTGPQITFNTLQANRWYNSDTTVSWTVTDASAGVDYFKWGWDTPIPINQVNASLGSTTLSAAGQGKHTLYVDAWDKAANKGSASLGWLGYDPLAPGILSISPGCSASDRQWQNTCRVPVFTWSASDPGANPSGIAAYQYAWGPQVQASPGANTTSTGYSPPAFAPVDGVGQYYLSLKTYDWAGNISGLATYGVWYDGAPPTLQPTINFGARYVTTSTVTIQPGGQDSASGLKSLLISDDGLAWHTQPYANSVSWTLTGPVGALNTVYLKLEDNLGNRSAAFPVSVCREASGAPAHPAGCWQSRYLPLVSRPVH